MNPLRLMVVAIYMIIGATLGIIIIPEVVNDLGFNQFPILTNHYIDGLIGIIVFLLFLVSLSNKLHLLLKT